MNCNFSVDISKAKSLEALRDYCGANTEQFLEYINSVVKEQAADGSLVPSVHFVEWYKEHYKGEPNFNAGTGSQMKDRIIRYYKEVKGDVESTYRNGATSQILSTYGYTSPYAREFGKRLLANCVLDFYRKTEFILRGKPDTYNKIQEDIKKSGVKTFYFDNVKKRFNRILSERIAARTGEDIKSVQNKLKTEGRLYAEKSLGGKNMSIQDSNLVALVYEFKTSPAALVEEVCRDSRLYKLFAKDDNFNDNNEPDVEGENNPENNEDEDNENFLNTSISMYDHSGVYTTAMTHVDTGIRVYLDSLKRLNSGNGLDNNTPDVDLNNPFGIADTMNADECVTVLYHYGNYDNVDSMIASIRSIADNIPGFAAFHQLAKDLEANSDIAYKFYTTFGKTIISKIETIVDGTITKTRLSNSRSNKLDALGFEFMNSIKITALNNDIDFAREELDELREYVGDKTTKTEILKSKDNKFRKNAIAKLAKQLRRYYPTISEYAIENYINNHSEKNKSIDVSKNFGNLITLLKKTIDASEGTKLEYKHKQEDIHSANNHNNKLKRKQEAGESVSSSEFIDLAPLYSKSYITESQEAAVLELAKALVDYSLIRVEINSRNIYGNQSSDVINNSYITNILKTLQNDTSLENYGKYRANSRQYDFSGIMIEQSENGEIINKGLFRRTDDGQLVPTSYAKDLLKIKMFSGASNLNTDTNVSYADMSQSDYVGTGYLNFFAGDNTDVADYFMRIPSDAPRNFSITAPRYSTSGLFKIANQSEVTKAELELRSRYAQKVITDLSSAVNTKAFDIKYSNQVVNHLFAEDESISIKLPPFVKGNKLYAEGNEVVIKFKYKNENAEEGQDVYLVRGIIENGRLNNGTLVGYNSNDNNSFSKEINNAIDKHIKKTIDRSGVIKYGVNKNHRIFKQFRNIFKQELLDAAVALNKFFVTDENGLVQRYSENEASMLDVEEGAIKWQEGVSKDGREVSGAYDNYHHKKGLIAPDEVIDQNGNKGYITKINGKEKITWFDGSNDKSRIASKTNRNVLVGNVFHSDRFVIFDRNNNVVRNYGNELIDEVFDFLYGGANNTYLHFSKNEDGSVKEITLTEAQEKAINTKIEEFITNYVDQGFNRLINLEGSLKGAELDYNNAAEFLLNYHLTYVGFNELFEGDTKFYKSIQDFLKRAKEVQGSGVPYGLTNYTAALGEGKAEITRSVLTGTTFANGYKVKQYNKFTAVTVVNTVMTNQSAIDTLKEKLIKSCKLSEADANRLLAGYTNTTVNDAQSYITFDEWIRRIAARGQLMQYKPLIDKILNNEELNAEELSEFIQVQKNFYFDQHYDTEGKVIAPRQIKNAEFVLVPQLIKGTELEAVAAIMKKYNIDQLNTAETSKAGKTNILEIFDSKTGKVKQDVLDEVAGKGISDFGHKATAASSLFSYNYLYTQQETPQHMNAQNKAGIQIMKKMLDNITPDSPLWETKQRFFRLYSANIRDSFQNLMEELNLEIDKDGNLVLEEDVDGNKAIKGLNVEVFCQRLKEECIRLGLDSNALDYVTLDADRMASNGFNTIMPNYLSMISQKLESIAQSLFNNRITRQKLPGFHAAQITNVGFRPLATSKEQVSYSNELKYHQDKKGNYAPYVEIMLPASAFGFKRTKEDGTLKTKEELLKELQDAKLDEIIGYRIPTEGKQSVCRMKVVGFIDDAYGSTIVVPNDWVTQTGSDFDIDSVYGIQFDTTIDPYGHIRKVEYSNVASKSYENYVKNNMSEDELKEAEENVEFNYNNWAIDNNLLSREEWSEENKDAVAADNSRASRNNAILQCMLDILGSNEALEENLSRSNFDDITTAIAKVMNKTVKLERENRSAYNFLDQAEYQEDAMSGARLKGYSVTRDTFCSICNTVRPTISNQHKVKIAYTEDIIDYDTAVKRFGKENVEKKNGKIIVTHNRIGWTNDNKNVVGKILTAYSSQTTAHILDAIKEGAVPNVNELTFAVYKIFPDLGADYDTAVAFMMQNGIRRIVDAYNATNSIYQDSKGDHINKAIRSIAKDLGYNVSELGNINQIIAQLQKDYGKEFATIFGDNAEITLNNEKLAEIAIDGKQLQDEISSPRKGTEGLLFELGVILQYSKLSNFGTSITSLTRVCNPDKFGAKQTIFATNKIFEDINDLINGNTEIPLSVGDKSFLEAIYPDVEKGLDEFITAPRKESAYPPLYNFLKYATATSIKINRSLFITQSPDFINAVNSIGRLLSDDGKLTEKQYKDIEKYIIGHLYNTCQSIMRPITFSVKGDIGFVPVALENETISDQEQLFETERRRIFGYGVSPEININIANVNEPTQEEVEEFTKLTPAQKVAFIQGHFSSAGVFNYIRPTIYNERASNNRFGSQTIEFIDTLANIEDVYQAFVNAFSSTNPLVALTAYDIIKYAFVAEGYKLKRNGVSKMIPNSVLYNDFGIYGTGFVTELEGKIRNIGELLSDDSIDKIHEDYIRSHNMYQIPTIKVQKPKGKYYELVPRHGGIIQIAKNKEGLALAEKYRAIYVTKQNEEPSVNSYVKLTFGDKTTLYKIHNTYDALYLYPLNNLEENEHGDFSANSANNIHAKEDYYTSIIDEYESQYYTFDANKFAEIADKYDINQYKAPKETNIVTSHKAKDFSLEHPADNIVGAIDKLKSDVQKHFGDNDNNAPLYCVNGGLHNVITHPGYLNGSTKSFILNKGTANERVVKLDIQAVDYRILKRLARLYLGKNTGKQISKQDDKYKDVIEFFRNNGIVSISENYPTVFVVKPATLDDGIRKSSLIETTTSFYKAMNRRLSGVDDAFAQKATQRLRDKGIDSNKSSVVNHIDEVVRTTAEYVASITEKTINGLKYFAEDPNGNGYLAVTDPGVIEFIKNDPSLVRKYLKTILDAEAIVTNFKIINELDIKSQNLELQRYLNKIKECVNDLQNNSLIVEAKELFANNYLAKLSNDPLIQQNILNILDGYHSTNSFTAWVNDLQDTTSPFMQVLTKQVISDIRAKEFEAVRKLRAWKAFVKNIKLRASNAGKSINFDNIVDEDGRFIQEFTQSLVDDMNQLRDAINSAKATYGEGSLEHLEAQLKYNKWKLEHINQELEDEYYQKRIQLDEEMLYGVKVVNIDENTGMPVESEVRSGGFPIVFTEYKKLEAKRRDILSHVVNGILDDYWKQQLDETNSKINDLIYPLYHDPNTGEFTHRVDYDEHLNPLTGTEEERRQKMLYSAASQRAIANYVKAVRELNTEYYGYDVEFGFEEELQRNLHIIESYERRDANGNITTPMNLLMENDEYVQAKQWLSTNARFVVSLAEDDELVRKLNEADKILRRGEDNKENSYGKVLGRLARERNAYDNKGVIDGSKFTDEDIASIKKDQQAAYDFREDAPFSDKTLISNGSPTGELYTTEFYKGMTSNGASNPEWYAKIHEINEILAPYYDNGTKTIRFDLIPNTEEGRKIYSTLEQLYNELAEIKKTTGGDNGKDIAKFIEDNVDFNIDEVEFAKQENLAKEKGGAYYAYWVKANVEIIDGQRRPNHYIYGYATPKAEVKDKYLDKKKTEALQLINKTYTVVPTEYYYQKIQEVKEQGKDVYNEWYHKNHIYNPYTHTYEPLRCWTARTFRDTSSTVGKWEANYNRLQRHPKEVYVNPDYKPEVGNALNYKVGTGYDNPRINVANEFETELKLEMQRLLSDLVKTKFGRQFIERGYLPSRAKDNQKNDAKFWGNEALKMIGWVEGHSGKEAFYEDLDYSRDKTIAMPMLSLLKQKSLESLKLTEPKRESYNTDEEYNAALDKYNKDVATLKAENKKAHQDAIDRNWESVMEDFILKASHFNAIQDNKYMLFYGKSVIEKLEVYQRKYGFFGDYKKDYINSDDNSQEYFKRKDDNLIKQYENWVRRLVYDQWKEPNAVFTKWASRLQSITSAQYMMMNVRGGIANITLGETNILAEAFAKDYFGTKDWLAGKQYWTAGVTSYFANMYKTTSTSVADAIIKFFNVVDFDELTGKSRIVENPVSQSSKLITDIAYSPQTIGENFMQNSAMFSMMMSHRLFEIIDPETNEKTIIFKNEHEATRDADKQALMSIIKDSPLEGSFKTFIDNIKSDPNKMKDYAWRRKDFITQFAKQYLTKEQQKEYAEKRDIFEKKAKDEFYNDAAHPRLIDQFALGDDQMLSFKKDSKLAEYDIPNQNGEPSKAYKLLADFRGRVISVNKKIHGVYDKLGQAQLEKLWYGSLVMQYHKHIYPGLLKRWRKEGSFNEERGTVEKGSYIALMDFLATPWRQYKDKLGMTDAQVEAHEGIQNFIKEVVDFTTNIKLNWHLLPEHEKANIRRCFGDLLGVASALLMAIALRCMMDDEDEDSILFNLALYEADRLASESFQFNPLGAYSEAKKLWSTPIAAQSGVQDLIQSVGLLSKMIIEGEDFDPYYHSGRFAGEHKLSVYIQRRIPIWRGIKTGFIDIVESNSYYKMGDNMLGIVPVESIVDWVKDKEE